MPFSSGDGDKSFTLGIRHLINTEHLPGKINEGKSDVNATTSTRPRRALVGG
jgi:hypothetical protein